MKSIFMATLVVKWLHYMLVAVTKPQQRRVRTAAYTWFIYDVVERPANCQKTLRKSRWL